MLVLQERYLRSDIPCGYACCTECASFPGYKPVLPSVGYRAHSKLQASPAGHWLIVDTNIVLHQMDLLISLPTAMPLIIPSTVLAETRHRSLPLYNRLQQLIADEEKRVWVFWNEERRETATKVERVKVAGGDDEDEDMERSGAGGRESVNDRNDRGEPTSSCTGRRSLTCLSAIRLTVDFYNAHLTSLPSRATDTGSHPSLVLLSDDRGNRLKAQESGLVAMSAREYVEGLPTKERDTLSDLIAHASGDRESTSGGVDSAGKTRIYPDVSRGACSASHPKLITRRLQYLPQAALTAGVKSGIFHQGYFNANPFNYLEGTVRSATVDRPILLVGRESMNRAVDGDVVVVQLLPQSEWKAPGEEVVDQDVALRDDDADDDEGEAETVAAMEARLAAREQAEAKQVADKQSKEVMPTGKVVGVMKRNWRA